MGWKKFAQTPEECNEELVREFFLHATADIESKIFWVRGKIVQINATMINEFYKIAQPGIVDETILIPPSGDKLNEEYLYPIMVAK